LVNRPSFPIEDRRRLDSSREGMLEGLSLGSYLLVVAYTGRLFREGKAVAGRIRHASTCGFQVSMNSLKFSVFSFQ
jgi:hypothetical protein